MGQPVVHWELWSKDPAKCSEFYEKVFDWNIKKDDHYHLVQTGGEGGIDGGIMKPQEGPWPGNMAFYINVDDLDVYGKKVVEAGGKIVVDKMKIPGVGSFTLFQDPDDRVLGMWLQDKGGK